MGDRYEAVFNGHEIELVRSEWTKVLKLVIDGSVAARAFCLLPRSVVLRAVIDEGRTRHEVVVRSVLRFPFYRDAIEVDGRALELTRTR